MPPAAVPPAPDELSSPVDASSEPPLLDPDASGLLPLLLPPEDVDEGGGWFKPDPPLEELPLEDPLLLVDDSPLEELLLFVAAGGGCIPWNVGVFDDPHPAATAARHNPKSIT
jgi:hypothetical protein